MPQVSYWRIAFLSLIVVSVTFVELGSARLWDRDEPRNARASHEMLARGDWIVPTFNGSLRDHKPILIYWGQMLSYLAVGESEFSARFRVRCVLYCRLRRWRCWQRVCQASREGLVRRAFGELVVWRPAPCLSWRAGRRRQMHV